MLSVERHNGSRIGLPSLRAASIFALYPFKLRTPNEDINL